MKRKALITATAVLLVAVMCLATASYAWFSSGSASTVSTLNLSVTSGDSGLEIAAANAKNGTYEAGAFSTSALSEADFETYGVVPSDANNTLEAVSTAGTTGTDGKYTFTPTRYDVATSTWIGLADKQDGYILASFYVKNSGEEYKGNLDVVFGEKFGAHKDFVGAAKIGYNVTYNTGVVAKGDTTTAPAGFETFQLDSDAEAYQDMLGEKAQCIKTDAGLFVPKTVADDTETTDVDEAALQASLFNEGVQNKTWAEADKSLTIAADSTALITVAIWIEGMDSDCAGAWEAGSDSVTITLS